MKIGGLIRILVGRVGVNPSPYFGQGFRWLKNNNKNVISFKVYADMVQTNIEFRVRYDAM